MFFENSSPKRKKRAMKNQSASEKARSFKTEDLPEPKHHECLSHEELFNGDFRTFIIDLECYPNYFLAGFKCLTTDKYIFLEIINDIHFINGFQVTEQVWLQCLAFIMWRFLTVGFNSKYYDIPIIGVALIGATNKQLKQVSNEIIGQFGENGLSPWQVKKKYNTNINGINHIDIMPVAPLGESLKTYSGRLHAKRMQELPYYHASVLDEIQIYYVRGYNVNDLDNTHGLFSELKSQIEMRERLGAEIGLDLRSRSDAQVAKDYIVAKLKAKGVTASRPDIKEGYTFFYKPPSWVQFKSPQLQHVYKVLTTTQFEVGHTGHVHVPKAVKDLNIVIDGMTYTIGNGGLHSTEKSIGFVSTPDLILTDRDVASYYPWLMIRNKWGPLHLGEAFFEVFEGDLVNVRMKAKARIAQIDDELAFADDQKKVLLKAEAKQCKTITNDFKIPLNGTFGNLIEKFGELYAPEQGMHVTITGQLGLLMQIEALVMAGFRVVSANTDGVVTLVPASRKSEYLAIYAAWERATGLETEETEYRSLWARDVNNYIAVKMKGGSNDARYLDERIGAKAKGVYCERGSALNSVLSKNPETLIVNDALMQFLVNNIPVEQTIYACKDIRRFVSIRKASGGAEKDEVYLGKVIRWYYSTDVKGTINLSNGNNVGKSEGAKPCMDLPDELPSDIDYEWYINEAIKQLYELGYYKKAHTMSLF